MSVVYKEMEASMDNNVESKIEHLYQINTSFFQYMRHLVEETLKTQPYHLTPTKFYILNYIASGTKYMVADISNKLHLTSGATTSLLNQLEEESLIQRVRDEKDRRVVWVSLTDESKQLVSMITEKRNVFLKDMLAALTVEEQEEYFRLLNKMDALLCDKYGFSY